MEYLYLSLSASGLYVDKRNTYGISAVINLRGSLHDHFPSEGLFLGNQREKVESV